ncbi:hypothetical protein [Listeria valentina]|uniref:hypothetical protein n=1 Tax=Listeria valentina TaxID=2705293 RepID=UPI0014303FB6|nr:hypothetical protein [Listeria valentina]
MQQLRLLMRRDCLLLAAKSYKRMIAVLFILIGITFKEAKTTAFEQNSVADLLINMMGGIPIEVLKDNPLQFPATWFLLLLIPILISHDFLRVDLFGEASHVLVKLSNRSLYWLSKCSVILMLNIVLLLSYISIIMAVSLLFRFDFSVFFRMLPYAGYLFLGMNLSCLFFVLLTLFVKEIAAVLLVMIFLCSGLRSTNLLFPTGHLMWVRHTDVTQFVLSAKSTLIYGGVLGAMWMGIGVLGITRIDILTTKNEE